MNDKKTELIELEKSIEEKKQEINNLIVVFDEKDLIHYPYCNCGCKMDEVTDNE